MKLSRLIHSWLGIIVLPLALIIGFTGFYLNHTKAIYPLFKQTGLNQAIASATTRDSSLPPLSLIEAMQVIEKAWPETPVKSIKEKYGKSGKRYIVKSTESTDRLVIYANTGTYNIKTPYRKLYYGYQGDHVATRYYWKRILWRLHTGSIGGDVGKLLADLISLALIVFALTGGYVWVVTRWRKHLSKKAHLQ